MIRFYSRDTSFGIECAFGSCPLTERIVEVDNDRLSFIFTEVFIDYEVQGDFFNDLYSA